VSDDVSRIETVPSGASAELSDHENLYDPSENGLPPETFAVIVRSLQRQVLSVSVSTTTGRGTMSMYMESLREQPLASVVTHASQPDAEKDVIAEAGMLDVESDRESMTVLFGNSHRCRYGAEPLETVSPTREGCSP
jgi:hypothetical protein